MADEILDDTPAEGEQIKRTESQIRAEKYQLFVVKPE